MLVSVILLIVIILPIQFFNFFNVIVRSIVTESDSYENEPTDYFSTVSSQNQPNINSLTDEKGVISDFDFNGELVITYNDNEYAANLADADLLSWLKQRGSSLENVDVLFSTDSDGNITSLAMLSDTFYVLEKQNDNYVVLRGEDVFFSTSNIPLDVNNYYEGYFSYPDINVHSATLHNGNGYFLLDAVCEEKAIQTISDRYTKEEISLPMIRIDSDWYYCSQQLYDTCTEGSVISTKMYIDSDMHILYAAN